MFVVSLLIVTFLSLISRILLLLQTTKEANPHPCIVPCVNMWSVFFFFFLCHLLSVGACICHIAQDGQVEWTIPQHLICCTLCYSIVSHATLIHLYHASMLTLHKFHNIMCTLVATCVILRSLECNRV